MKTNNDYRDSYLVLNKYGQYLVDKLGFGFVPLLAAMWIPCIFIRITAVLLKAVIKIAEEIPDSFKTAINACKYKKP